MSRNQKNEKTLALTYFIHKSTKQKYIRRQQQQYIDQLHQPFPSRGKPFNYLLWAGSKQKPITDMKTWDIHSVS